MYYVYRHIRLDKNEVFYIGRGKHKQRLGKVYPSDMYYRAYDKSNRNRFWNNITRKTEYKVEIIFNTDSEQESMDKEMYFINLYGRKDLGKGTLCNLTNGGEKETGKVFSEEYRRKLSKAATGRVKSYETICKLKESLKGRLFSEEHKKNISLSKTGIKLNDEAVKKRVSSRCGKAKEKGYYHSDETRIKMKESAILWHKNNKSNSSKKVINTITKEIFESVKSVAIHIGCNYDYIQNRLRGKVLNNTSYMYLKEYEKK